MSDTNMFADTFSNLASDSNRDEVFDYAEKVANDEIEYIKLKNQLDIARKYVSRKLTDFYDLAEIKLDDILRMIHDLEKCDDIVSNVNHSILLDNMHKTVSSLATMIAKQTCDNIKNSGEITYDKFFETLEDHVHKTKDFYNMEDCVNKEQK